MFVRGFVRRRFQEVPTYQGLPCTARFPHSRKKWYDRFQDCGYAIDTNRAGNGPHTMPSGG
jgi:hypothetical protein